MVGGANYAHFIISLSALLIMVTVTVDGLIRFLLGRWEIRALREFISEVNSERKIYLGDD